MAAPLTALAAVATAQAGVLTGFEAFRGQAAGGAVRGVVTVLAVVPGAMLLGAGGAVAGYALAAAAGQEFVFVLSGSIELTYDGKRCLLGPGDSAYLDARRPHLFRGMGASPSRMVAGSV